MDNPAGMVPVPAVTVLKVASTLPRFGAAPGPDAKTLTAEIPTTIRAAIIETESLLFWRKFFMGFVLNFTLGFDNELTKVVKTGIKSNFEAMNL